MTMHQVSRHLVYEVHACAKFRWCYIQIRKVQFPMHAGACMFYIQDGAELKRDKSHCMRGFPFWLGHRFVGKLTHAYMHLLIFNRHPIPGSLSMQLVTLSYAHWGQGFSVHARRITRFPTFNCNPSLMLFYKRQMGCFIEGLHNGSFRFRF